MKKLTNYDELLYTIREQMAVQGITQTQMASDLELSQPYLNRLFRRKNVPSAEVVFKLTDYLQIKLAYSI